MSRKKIVAGNWKMNKDYQAGLELISEAVYMIKDELHKEVSTIFASPFIHLASIQKLMATEKNFHVAAQNCHHEKSGAYTGEVSAEMIKSVGVEYVIIGHSERREYQQEDAAMLAKKVNLALQNGLIPIFCFGEKLEERESGKHFDTVENQLSASLFHLTNVEIKNIVLAYEPVWAIGTGKTASPEQAQEMHAFIRKIVSDKYSTELAEGISILYGGSCNPSNAKSLFSQKDIDGGLIGGASLKSRDFTDIHLAFNEL
jgi:triosephosphate isomerase